MTALLLLASMAAAEPVPPMRLSAEEAGRVREEVAAFREKLEASLRPSATSYLAAAARKDLGFGTAKEATLGSAADDGIKLDGLAPHQVKISLSGKWTVTGSFNHDAEDKTELVTADGVWLTVGRHAVRLSNPSYGSIMAFDPQNPRLKDYKPRSFYPVDLSYRFAAPLIPDPKPERFEIVTTAGHSRPATRVGWFDLLIKGKPVRIAAYREESFGTQDLSLYFQDETGGKETYKVGRYINPVALPDGRYLIDFNLAYNPVCAFSPYYACPYPRKENALPVPIRAGEKSWKK